MNPGTTDWVNVTSSSMSSAIGDFEVAPFSSGLIEGGGTTSRATASSRVSRPPSSSRAPTSRTASPATTPELSICVLDGSDRGRRNRGHLRWCSARRPQFSHGPREASTALYAHNELTPDHCRHAPNRRYVLPGCDLRGLPFG